MQQQKETETPNKQQKEGQLLMICHKKGDETCILSHKKETDINIKPQKSDTGT